MVRPKDEVRRIPEDVPDDASFEEIRYRIYVHQKIKRGLEDIDRGRLLTRKEVETANIPPPGRRWNV
jgi:predicted transcriptional regulator